MLSVSLLEVFFLGFLMGLVPGPVVTSLFAETIRKGWRAARRIVIWAAAGELVMSIACVALFSAVLSPQSPLLAALSAGGAIVLLALARDLWRVRALQSDQTLFTNRRVFTIAVLNGMAWIFWITVCTPQALSLDAQIRLGRWLFIVLFEAGWACSTLLLCVIFDFFRPYLQEPKRIHAVYRLIALVFVLFAVKLAVASVRALLH